MVTTTTQLSVGRPDGTADRSDVPQEPRVSKSIPLISLGFAALGIFLLAISNGSLWLISNGVNGLLLAMAGAYVLWYSSTNRIATGQVRYARGGSGLRFSPRGPRTIALLAFVGVATTLGGLPSLLIIASGFDPELAGGTFSWRGKFAVFLLAAMSFVGVYLLVLSVSVGVHPLGLRITQAGISHFRRFRTVTIPWERPVRIFVDEPSTGPVLMLDRGEGKPYKFPAPSLGSDPYVVHAIISFYQAHERDRRFLETPEEAIRRFKSSSSS
ncbi:hypothetical protein [Leucobacter iarius]|uniref:PH domain-containing protein n=1 Tax=Leucobacter iarius TaxID=333963 RepID=A0ABN2LFR5_9MICO